jgi:hypothetical protein
MANSVQFQMAIATASVDDDQPSKEEQDNEPMLTMPDREERHIASGNRNFASRPGV